LNQSNPNTAEAILQRLLVVLPVAAQGGGTRIDPLAEQLGVEAKRLLRDLRELEGRSYYLPPGLGDQIQLTVTREHLEVWTSGEFRRPVRLTPREALALELGLRTVVRSTPDGDRPAFQELRERTVASLRTPTAADAEDPAIALGTAEAGDDPLRERIEVAMRDRRVLRLDYHSPGRGLSTRLVGPIVLAHAEGRWYLLARDLDGEGVRAFRLDRILGVEATESDFSSKPEDAAAVERFFQDGRIHDGGGPEAPEPFEAIVEYSASIARWVRERGWAELVTLESGNVRVRHQVVDPEWLWRHVLSYGAEAWIAEPEWARVRLVERLSSLLPTAPGAAPSDP
jgi:predicted DNA-binding transcriptional regulator YafY